MWILYGRELRAALREKTVVLNSLLLPVFLYPFVMWLTFTGLLFVEGQTESWTARVEARDWPKAHPGLERLFRREARLEWLPASGSSADAERRVREGRADVLLEFRPAADTAATLAGNFTARVVFDESKEASVAAKRRVGAVLARYRDLWLQRAARERGIDAAAWRVFTLEMENTASSRQLGTMILGLMLPLLFVVMVALGCFYPAVDATAGEHERHTWETLLSTSANRPSILVAKYLYVTTLGGVAGVLNVTALLLTLRPVFGPLMARVGGTLSFSVPWAALPLIALAALLLAGFVAAGMMIFASFARTFKEGQAMITPFYLLVLLPVMFLVTPGLKFSLPLAWVPVVNLTLMTRSAIEGAFPAPQIALTLAVSLGLIVACLFVARYLLRFEEVLSGAAEDGLRGFVRRRLRERAQPSRPTPPGLP